jgi:hypothetical protein
MFEYEVYSRICFAECKDLNVDFMSTVLQRCKEMWRDESCVESISLYVCLLASAVVCWGHVTGVACDRQYGVVN